MGGSIPSRTGSWSQPTRAETAALAWRHQPRDDGRSPTGCKRSFCKELHATCQIDELRPSVVSVSNGMDHPSCRKTGCRRILAARPVPLRPATAKPVRPDFDCSHNGKNFGWPPQLRRHLCASERTCRSAPAAFHIEKPETTSRQLGRREKVRGEPFCRLRGIPLGMFRSLWAMPDMPSFARETCRERHQGRTRESLRSLMPFLPWRGGCRATHTRSTAPQQKIHWLRRMGLNGKDPYRSSA